MTLRARDLLCLSLLSTLASTLASAATVDDVSPGGQSIVLRLTDEETESLKVGDRVTIQLPLRKGLPAAPATVGDVATIANGLASITVDDASDLAVGTKVTVRAMSGVGPTLASAEFDMANEQAATITAPRAPSTEGDSFGSHGGFDDHLFHAAMVSPAQLYQTDDLRTDVETGLSTINRRKKVDGTIDQLNLSGPELAVGVVSPLRGRSKARLGIALEHAQLDGRVRMTGYGDGDYNEKLEITETTMTPMMAYDLGESLTAGFAYRVVQQKRSGEHYPNAYELSYALPVPGVLYRTPRLEAGVVYEPAAHDKSSIEVTSDERGETIELSEHTDEPARVSLHGRARIGKTYTSYGVLTYNQNTAMNVDGTESWNDNVELTAGLGKRVDAETGIDGALFLFAPAWSDEEEKQPDNLMRYGLSANFDKRMSEGTRFGAGLLYILASDADKGSEGETIAINRDELQLTVNGSLKL